MRALAAAPAPEAVSPGFAGFLAVFVLAVATVFLVRSMVGHLRKVRYGAGPVDPVDGPDATGRDGTAGPADPASPDGGSPAGGPPDRPGDPPRAGG